MKNKIFKIFLLISITSALDSEGKKLSLSLYSYNREGIFSKNYDEENGPLKPMLLSMFVPGLGQYLQGDKKRAWFFFGAELLSLTANKYYNNQADEDVLEYKNFANKNWSFQSWIDNYECWNGDQYTNSPNCANLNPNFDYGYLFSQPISWESGGEDLQYSHIYENSHHIDFFYNDILVRTNSSEFQSLYEEFKNWNYNGEDFIDSNGDGIWNEGEDWVDVGNGIWDEGEDFIDSVGNGVYDLGENYRDCGVDNLCPGDDTHIVTYPGPDEGEGNGAWDEGEVFYDSGNGQFDQGESWEDEPNGIYDEGSCNGQSFVDCYGIEVVKDHHFYEGIRKYNVFFSGWNDAAVDIIPTVQNSTNVATSPNKRKYNQTWNKSIQLYDYAQYALTAIYLNHLISIFDVYLKSKFDGRFNVEVQNKYDSKTKTPNYLFKLSVDL